MCLTGKITTKRILKKDAITAYKVVVGEAPYCAPCEVAEYKWGVNYSATPGFHAFATRRGAKPWCDPWETIIMVKLYGMVRFGEQYTRNGNFSAMSATRMIIERPKKEERE